MGEPGPGERSWKAQGLAETRTTSVLQSNLGNVSHRLVDKATHTWGVMGDVDWVLMMKRSMSSWREEKPGSSLSSMGCLPLSPYNKRLGLSKQSHKQGGKQHLAV